MAVLIKNLGYTVEQYGLDQYWCDDFLAWRGPGLREKLQGRQGLVFNRTSVYGDYAAQVVEALEKENWLVIDPGSKVSKYGDKWESYVELQSIDVPIIPTVLVSSTSTLAPAYSYPVVVKARKGSGGREVYLANNFHDYLGALQALFSKNNNGVLVQPHVAGGDKIRDIRVHVALGRKALVLERTASADSWRTNLSQGATTSEYQGSLLEFAGRLAEKIAQRTGLLWCAVDFLVTEGEDLILCEVNPCPGVAGTVEQVGDKPISSILDTIIRYAERMLRNTTA